MTFRVAVIAVTATAALFAGAGTAVAQDNDAKFADAVSQLQIPTEGLDVPALGKGICDMLSNGLATSINPVPVVRGVRDRLTTGGITREQASGLMRAASAAYCPQLLPKLGR